MILARLLLLLPLSGCVVLPIPLGEGHVSSGREIAEGSQGALVIGTTTREDALKRLGPPSAVWDEAGIVIYDWDRVHWILVWVLAGAGRAAAGGMEMPTHHMVLLQFDSAGVLRRAEHVERPDGVGYGAFLRDWAARGSGSR